MRLWCRATLAAVTLLAVTGVSQGATPLRHELLDDFRNAGAWQASASDQVKSALRADASDGSLCLDYDFNGVSGYVGLQRELAIEYPPDYAFSFQLRGDSPANDLQFKLVDASGDNVW